MKYNNYDILFILGSLSTGGVEKINISIANHLSKDNKKKICIVSLTNLNPVFKTLVSDKVDLIIFNKSRVYQSFFDFFFLIRKIRPKIIFSAMKYINVFALITNKVSLVNSKIIVSERIDAEYERLGSDRFRTKFQLFFFKYFLKKIYMLSDQIHCISEGVKESHNRIYGIDNKFMKVIYNPIDLSVVNEEKIINKYKKADEVLNILTVGRLVKQKDHKTLIRSLELIKDKISFHLHIVGDGPELNRLISLSEKLNLSNNITFVGNTKNPWSYYERADIFILSSIYEGLGNVIVEALAFNCKVISSDCPSGPSEILENGKWGHLFPVGDHKYLSNVIIKVANKNLYPNSRSRSEFFSIDTIGDQYDMMFNKTLGIIGNKN